MKNTRTDTLATSLQALSEDYKAQGINVFDPSEHQSLMQDDDTFSFMTERYLDGIADEADQEVMLGMMENARGELLQEAVIGINPVAPLTMPMLRRAFPSLIMPKVVPTKVATQPKFITSTYHPYIVGANGEKRYLPDAFYEATADYANRQKVDDGDILADGSEHDLFGPASLSKANSDMVDSDAMMNTVTMSVLDAAAGDAELVTVDTEFKLIATSGLMQGTVTASHSDGTETSDMVFGVLDAENGTIVVTSAKGTVTKVTLEAYNVSMNNNHTEEVSFEFSHKETVIPQAVHISAPIRNEEMLDLLKAYKIDGVSKVVSIMADTIANKVDAEGVAFIDNAVNPAWARSFNTHPTGAYTGSPSSWKAEIRPVIDHLAGTMVTDLKMGNQIEFVIYGNPLDTALIPDTEWTFSGGTDEQDGVRVDYSVGSARGAYNYTVVSKQNIAKGALTIVAIPQAEDMKTFCFFPYSFMMTRPGDGHSNPTTPNVPAIVASRRYTYEKFIPKAAAKITILNNDGSLPA